MSQRATRPERDDDRRGGDAASAPRTVANGASTTSLRAADTAAGMAASSDEHAALDGALVQFQSSVVNRVGQHLKRDVVHGALGIPTGAQIGDAISNGIKAMVGEPRAATDRRARRRDVADHAADSQAAGPPSEAVEVSIPEVDRAQAYQRVSVAIEPPQVDPPEVPALNDALAAVDLESLKQPGGAAYSTDALLRPNIVSTPTGETPAHLNPNLPAPRPTATDRLREMTEAKERELSRVVLPDGRTQMDIEVEEAQSDRDEGITRGQVDIQGPLERLTADDASPQRESSESRRDPALPPAHTEVTGVTVDVSDDPGVQRFNGLAGNLEYALYRAQGHHISPDQSSYSAEHMPTISAEQYAAFGRDLATIRACLAGLESTSLATSITLSFEPAQAQRDAIRAAMLQQLAPVIAAGDQVAAVVTDKLAAIDFAALPKDVLGALVDLGDALPDHAPEGGGSAKG